MGAAIALLVAPAAAVAAPDDPPPPPTGLVPPDAPDPPPGVPRGTAQEAKALTADQGNWEDGVTLTNDWRRCSATACESTGETGSRYVLRARDVGRRIKLRVRGERAGILGGSRTADSPLTAVISAAPVPPSNTSAPEITGVAQEGQTLSASQGTWTGTSPITYSYEWLRCTATCAPTGITATTYALTAADAESRLKVVVTATNAAGSAVASATSAVVAALPTALPPGDPPPEDPPAESPPSESPPAGAPSPDDPPRPVIRRLSPFPVVIVSGRATGGGAVITQLSARRAPRGATLTVRCTGRDCPFGQARRKFRRSSRLRLRALEIQLRAGTVVTVLIRKGPLLGKYTRIRIRRNAPPARVDRCVAPGSLRPVPCAAP
ncbi:MAG: hypothetical protein M3356_05995 [Actinomycetota bacterium]|nr:hypothetical protein [Actinomycetota bacterium]